MSSTDAARARRADVEHVFARKRLHGDAPHRGSREIGRTIIP